MTFQIKDTRKTLDIQDPSGEVVKEYVLDVGNYESLKRWSKDLHTVSEIEKRLNVADVEVMDQIVSTMKDVINAILGDGSFDELWDLFTQNLLTCIAFVKSLSDFVNEQIREIKKEYV